MSEPEAVPSDGHGLRALRPVDTDNEGTGARRAREDTNMTTRWIARLGAALLVALAAGCAQTPTEQDTGYVKLEPPQAVASGERIEVIEFFWYSCPHCNSLYPDLKEWVKTLPPDVAMRYHHAVFRASMETGARIHYTMQALGEGDKHIGALFEATFLDALDLADDEVLYGWVAKQGIDRQRFAAVYRSPAMDQQVAQARQRSVDYQLRGVPAFVVDGKYLTSPSISGDMPLLERVSKLVDKARKERLAAKR